MAIRTFAENLGALAARLLDDLQQLLETHSRLRWRDPIQGDLLFTGPEYAFEDLDGDGKRLQSEILKQFPRLFGLFRAALQDAPEHDQTLVVDVEKGCRDIAEQRHMTWHKSPGAAFQAVRKRVNELLAAVGDLHDATEGSTVLVPDTNALLYAPDLATWTFDDVPRFEIVLVPAVLAELDTLKVNHRNPEVREKAERLIRQIKDYRRRGSLAGGVPIHGNRVTLRAVAVEPAPAAVLSWLSPQSADDVLLASTLVVMRDHPRTPVALITRDINLQNKAEFAGVPFLEPPEPTLAAG
jgi:rRNA-processing protein FCF1